MKMQAKDNRILSLTAVLLFAVFALCVLASLLSGAEIYRSVTQRDRDSYDRRTAVQYISTRLRQADARGAVAVEEYEGLDALVLTENINGRDYSTRVYCYDGYLCELFTAADNRLEPQAGERILPLEELTLSLEQGLLTAEFTFDDGESRQASLMLRSEGVQP